MKKYGNQQIINLTIVVFKLLTALITTIENKDERKI
jgi:hypothetical protein